MKKKKLKLKDFLKILEINTKENPFDITDYNRQTIIDCRLNDNIPNRISFYIKYNCIKCDTSVIKNLDRKSRISRESVFLCKTCHSKHAFFEKYGVENPSQSEDIKEKKKKTCLINYGVDNPMKSIEIKEKAINTNIKKYGNKCSLHGNNQKETEQVFINKYGVNNPNKLDSVKNKIKKTKLDRYNDENYTNREKAKQTNSDRYGVDNYAKTKEFKERVKDTCLEKYGVDHHLKCKSVKEKRKYTTKKHFNVENVFQSNEIKNKIKQTNLDKYGECFPWNTEEAINKRKNTLISKYGTVNVNHKYLIDDMRLDSSWEVAFYIYHKDKNHIIKHGKEIKSFSYTYKTREHFYEPDFKIGNKYYEIKGDQFLTFYKNGKIKGMQCPFDHSKDALYNAKYKCMKKHKVTIIESTKIKKYLEYIDKIYGLEYLNNFRIENEEQ